ncbi:MAG: GNAT family N-acetyltransferase [Candidatus Sumerlaeota bacterium]|nr:GNAT family N-acetyltransferase [Candidatus Sumerlaeota bacterium]
MLNSATAAAFELAPFHPEEAKRVLDWIRDEAELRLVSPYTPPPLTPEKIMVWQDKALESFLFRDPAAGPVGYGELCAAGSSAEELWVAHVVVDPARRGQGVGRRFVQRLVERAFHAHRASRVILSVCEDNAAARSCYDRCGFRAFARRPLRAEWLPDGAYLVDMRIERLRWRAQRWREQVRRWWRGAPAGE